MTKKIKPEFDQDSTANYQLIKHTWRTQIEKKNSDCITLQDKQPVSSTKNYKEKKRQRNENYIDLQSCNYIDSKSLKSLTTF